VSVTSAGQRLGGYVTLLKVTGMIVCLCFLMTLFPACTKSTGSVGSAEKSANAPASIARTSETRSTVAAGNIPEGNKWRETILPSHESLLAVQFTSAESGWVASATGSLYRTTDGGIKWSRVELRNRPGNYLVSLNFVGDKLGWAVFSKYPSDYLDYKAYSLRILHTDDGGESWKPQFEKQQVSINQIRFNQQEGWATGVSYDANRTSHLILHTTDQGKHWEDRSKEFERAVNSPASFNFAIDIYAAQPSQATVLTVGGRVMLTDNGGQAWREIGTIADEFQQTGFMRIGWRGNETVWALGGTDGKEGIWSVLSFLNKDNSWTNHRAMQVFYRDAVFLADGKAIACGSVPDYEDPQKVTDRRAAVISYSSDEGRNWSIVYRSIKAKHLNALSALDANHIWAVGDGGLIVRLEQL
jgi:photosystem II stability/assembly factor-like uncharacterized protein